MRWQTLEIKTIADDRGQLCVVENTPTLSLPDQGLLFLFPIKRVYWVTAPDHQVTRGGHAHHKTHQVFICVSGYSQWYLEGEEGSENLVLQGPSLGLYIPDMVWHEISLAPGTVILALASEIYDEDDYIRDYSTWLLQLRIGLQHRTLPQP